MTQDEDGNWWPPEEVVEMVEEDFNTVIEEKNELFFASDPPDLDAFEAQLSRWYSGPYLTHFQETYFPNLRMGDGFLSVGEWEECIVQVDSFISTGLECRLARSCRNGTRYRYDFGTDELTSEYVEQMGTVVFRMRYDPTDGRWKLYEFLEFIPPSEM